MAFLDVFADHQNRYTSPAIARVIFALRQDKTIWNCLQNGERGIGKIFESNNNASTLSPANIGLKLLGQTVTAEKYAISPMKPLEPDLEEKTHITFEEFQSGRIIPASLAEMVLIGMGLREQRRKNNSWEGVLEALKSGDDLVRIAWQPVLICLFEMIPDRLEMLEYIAGIQNDPGILKLINRVVLGNPIEYQDQLSLFEGLLVKQPLFRQLVWLRLLEKEGNQELVGDLANAAISAMEEKTTRDYEGSLFDTDFETFVLRASELKTLGEIAQLAGQDEKAVFCFGKSQKILEQCQLCIHSIAGMIEKPVSTVIRSPEFPGDARIDQIRENDFGSIQAEITHDAINIDKENLFNQVTEQQLISRLDFAIELFRDGKIDPAVEIGQGVAQSIIRKNRGDTGLTAAIYSNVSSAEKIIEQLEVLGMTGEALDLAESFLELRPADQGIIRCISRLISNQGVSPHRLDAALLNMLLDAGDVNAHREIAGLREALGQFDRACAERKIVVELLDEPEPSDWLELARTAFMSRDFNIAIDSASKISDGDVMYNKAILIKSQSLINIGYSGEAAVYLDRLTREDPAHSVPWLLLAEVYEKEGRVENHRETLERAIEALPGSAEINLGLARVYLASNQDDEALPFLRKAAVLSPGDAEISLNLGKTLMNIGQLDEARQVLAHARKLWPQDLQLARIGAKVLIDLGETEAALEPLEIVIGNDPPDYQYLMLYAEALLGGKNALFLKKYNRDHSRIIKAQKVLEQAVEMEAQSIEANLLLAEVLIAEENYENAFPSYQRLLEFPDSLQPEWRWRIQSGLGQSALKMGKVETALVVLREAAQENLDNIDIHRLLAEAYRLTGLAEDASNTARYVLQMMPDDPGTLAWFGDMARMLGEDQAAHDAYKTAAQMDPENSTLLMELAELQTKLGDLEGGKHSLAKLLNLNNLQADHWRRAAYLFFKTDDRLSALTCLEQSLELDQEASAEILFETACIQLKGGDLESSLESIRKAISHKDYDWYVRVFESDILSVLGNYEEALVSLVIAREQVQELLKGIGTLQREFRAEMVDMLPNDWLKSLKDMTGLDIRFADLEYKLGDINSAIEYASRVSEGFNNDPVINIYFGELMRMNLQDDDAVQLLAKVDRSSEELQNLDSISVNEFIALEIESALDKGSVSDAVDLLDRCQSMHLDSPRLQAANSRILMRQGDIIPAKKFFDLAWQTSQSDQSVTGQGPLDDFTGTRLLKDIDKGCELWLAEAAIDLYEFEKAIQVLEKATLQYPNNARANLIHAKALIMAAEFQQLCGEVKVIAHAPGQEATQEPNYSTANKFIQAVAPKLNKENTYRLSMRAQLAFHPGLQAIQSLDWKKLTPEEALPIASHLRRLNETSAAISVILQLPVNELTLIQQALCYLGRDPEKGIKAAREAVNACPGNPIFLAILSILAQKEGNIEIALDAVEKALQIWDNESEWHAMAASLSGKAGDRNSAVYHWEKAASLNPLCVDYSIHLGNEYLALDDKRKAIHVLEVSAKANPTNFDVHYSLAKVLLAAGRVNETLDIAERANKLNPDMIENLMICAEASSQLRKWQSALEYANQVIKKNPDHLGAVLLISRVFSTQGKMQEALDIIETSSRNVVSSEEIAFERVKLIRSLSGGRAALPAIKDLIENFDKNPIIFRLLAEIQAELGDYKNAADSAEKSLQIDPCQPDLYCLMGKLKLEQGDVDQAIHFLKEAVLHKPEILEVYYDLSKAYVEKREFLLALGVYEQIIKIAPGDYQPYYSAGMIQRDIKDYKGAEKMLRKAAELAPNDLNIRRQLGAVIALNLVHNKQEAGSN